MLISKTLYPQKAPSNNKLLDLGYLVYDS